MVPSKRALRREGRSQSFKLPYFLYTTHQDAARLSPVPNLKPSELAAAGRVAGYHGEYGDACGGLCFPGLLNVETEVHAFRTFAQASRFIATQRAAYARLEQNKGRYGTVTSVEPFNPGALGDDAIGFRSAQAVAYTETYTETFTETLILFRIQEVVGVSSAVVLNQQVYPDRRALALARFLEERIRAVLIARAK